MSLLKGDKSVLSKTSGHESFFENASFGFLLGKIHYWVLRRGLNLDSTFEYWEWISENAIPRLWVVVVVVVIILCTRECLLERVLVLSKNLQSTFWLL